MEAGSPFDNPTIDTMALASGQKTGMSRRHRDSTRRT
jgi:hypothetical protein